MTLHTSSIGLLCLSWLASGVVGGIIALHLNHSTTPLYDTVKAKHLAIVDGSGTERIALDVAHNQPSIRILSVDQTTLLRLAVDRVAPSDPKSPYLQIQVVDLNDDTGKPAIQMFGGHDQRGLIGFSSPQFEGKLMLGHFGISDDGTDTGMWGIEVSSRLHGLHTDRMMGVMTFNGNDTLLVWPGDVAKQIR